MDMAADLHSLYSHEIGREYIECRLAAGEMFGAFKDGELAGFIGLHEEGSMGMLEVLAAFRRMGVGSLLVATLCRFLMERGLTPFSQFTVDNLASRALHESMGFSISTEFVFWLEPVKAYGLQTFRRHVRRFSFLTCGKICLADVIFLWFNKANER